MEEQQQQKPKKHNPNDKKDQGEILVRIMGRDILGNKNLYSGLTRIKGVSWNISNYVCRSLNMPRATKIASLSKDDIKKIENKITNLDHIAFLKNRRGDFDTGEVKHLLTNTLDMNREFDIKRMKTMKSYKGMRHSLNQPVRGQSTRSHFRQKGKATGVKKGK